MTESCWKAPQRLTLKAIESGHIPWKFGYNVYTLERVIIETARQHNRYIAACTRCAPNAGRVVKASRTRISTHKDTQFYSKKKLLIRARVNPSPVDATWWISSIMRLSLAGHVRSIFINLSRCLNFSVARPFWRCSSICAVKDCFTQSSAHSMVSNQRRLCSMLEDRTLLG